VSVALELAAAARTLREVGPELRGPLAGLADPFAELFEERAVVAARDARGFETGIDAVALTAARRINGSGGSATASPNGCGLCGIEERGHARQWRWPVGWHAWTAPTKQQINNRMLARRAGGRKP
jgi:hypothetical protein